jgi:hypothetical protein
MGSWGFVGVKILLLTTGVHIHAQIFRPPLGHANDAHVKVY